MRTLRNWVYNRKAKIRTYIKNQIRLAIKEVIEKSAKQDGQIQNVFERLKKLEDKIITKL